MKSDGIEIDQIEEYKRNMARRFQKPKPQEEIIKESIKKEEVKKEEINKSLTDDDSLLMLNDSAIIMDPDQYKVTKKGWVSDVKYFDLSKGSENELKLKSNNKNLNSKIIPDPILTPDIINLIEGSIDTRHSLTKNDRVGSIEERDVVVEEEEKKEEIFAEQRIDVNENDLDLHVFLNRTITIDFLKIIMMNLVE